MSEVYGVGTSLGLLDLTFTDANHVYASSPSNSVLTVNSVDYRVGMHLYRWQDGQFHMGKESENLYQRRQSLHAARPYTGTRQDGAYATEAARTKLEAHVTMCVNDFVKITPGAPAMAQREHLQQKMEMLQHQYAAAMEKADSIRKERDAAQEVFQNFVAEANQ